LAERPGVELEVLLPRAGAEPDRPDPQPGELGVEVRRVLPRWVGSFRRHPQDLLAHSFAGREVRATDVVHAMVEFPYGVTAARMGRRLGVPHVISGQGTYCVTPLLRAPDRLVYGWALRSAAAVTAPSRYTASALRAACPGPVALHVVPNAVDPSWLVPPGKPERLADLGLPAGVPFVLSVGASKPRKGWDLLVRAFQIVRQARPEMHLVLAGSGDREELRSLAGVLGVGPSVHVLGRVAQADLIALYQGCEFFALLPRKEGWHFEGFGLVYLEAGLCGKPSVASRSGGVPEVVLDGETGLLVDEEDAPGAAAAMLRLLENPRRLAELGTAARAWAAEHTWAAYIDRLLGLYASAASAPRRAPVKSSMGNGESRD
jgi:phosphatidylinositol alpha-1,6-mannosyltransferase